jgi:hypothetical protein
MTGVASEDSVRRGMKAMDEAASGEWMKKHLKVSYCCQPASMDRVQE